MTEELRRDSERLATLQDRREHLEGMLADLQQGGDGGEGGQGGQ